MTSSSSSPFSFLTSSISFQPTATTFTARTDLSPLSPTRMFDTSLFTLIARVWILVRISDSWMQPSLLAVGTALPFMGPGVPSLTVFSSRPSDPCSSAPLLDDCFSDPPLSSHRVRSGPCFVLLAHAADVFSWIALFVSTRARHPRSLASSRLTATFWSSSSPSRHFRAASCATSRLVFFSSSIFVVVYIDVAAGGHSSTAV